MSKKPKTSNWNNPKIQKDLLGYLKKLKDVFQDYRKFISNASGFFQSLKNMGMYNDETRYNSNKNDKPVLSYQELQKINEIMPTEIPDFAEYPENMVFSSDDKKLLKEQLIWLIETLKELGLKVDDAPKGTDAWLKEANS